MLTFRVLGPFVAHRSDGDAIPLTSRKAQGLLAYLAVEGVTSRDVLAHLFWGGLSQERARHNLRQALSRIRRDCGAIIESDGEMLALATESASFDVTDFTRLSQQDDAASLEQCLAIYGGDLLQGASPREEEFEDWLRLTRDRLRGIACDAMDRYVQHLMGGDALEQAIAAINRRLAMDPACEPAHRNLMTTLVRLGRRSDALRQYEVCADALKRELGVEPSPETTALLNEIRNAGGVATPEPPASDPERAPEESETPRVAVLPFENLSGESDGYFVDGITEDIITALSRFHSLQVIARGSTFVYKDKQATDSEVAEALGARFLVRGSVQLANDRVRINVQLLDGPNGLTLWAHRYDREMTDVFQVQDEITSTVVSTLAGRVEATELARARKATRKRLAAYDYLLRGKDHHHRFTPDDCATCIDMFNRAIERDPDYALAHAWLACGLGQAMVFGLEDFAVLLDRSQVAAERGLELDENESECHRILAQVHLIRGDLSRALRHQERALFLNPNDDRSVCAMGEILSFLGRHEEAEEWVRKAMALNPYHPQRYWTHLARALLHLGRHAEALEKLEQIGRPRRDDLAYAVVASVGTGDADAVRRNVDALRVDAPDFDVDGFVPSLRYERAADRELIRDALIRAGL